VAAIALISSLTATVAAARDGPIPESALLTIYGASQNDARDGIAAPGIRIAQRGSQTSNSGDQRRRRGPGMKPGEKGPGAGQFGQGFRPQQGFQPDPARTAGGGNARGPIWRFDKNDDGKISRSEWPKNPAVFNFMDADKDGYLTPGEMASGKQQLSTPAAAIAVTATDDGPSLTLDEAEKVTAEAGDQPVAALPPTINDITSILDEQKPAYPNMAERMRRAAQAEPPKGASNSELVTFYRERGMAAARIGDSAQQRSDLQKAIELAGRTNSKQLSRLLTELSVVELHRGQAETAIELRQRALSLVQGMKGAGGLKVKNESMLVALYTDAGKVALAKRKMAEVEQLLGDTKRFAPPDLWRYVWFPRALLAKARLMQATGRYDKAATLLQASLKLIIEANKRGLDNDYGKAHIDNIRRNLAMNYLHQGRIVEAEIEARHALLDALSTAGKYSARTPPNLMTLVVVLREQGRLAEATKLAAAALETMQTMGLEKTSLGVIKAKQVLASAHTQAGEIEAALKIYDDLASSLGPGSEIYRRTMLRDNDWTLALVLGGRQDEAIPIIQEALKQEEEKSGFGMMRKGVLAMALARAGKISEARALFRQTVPKLVAASDDQQDEDYASSTSKAFRTTAILEGYIGLLADLAEKVANGAEKQQLGAEALRIADAARGRLVQNAVAAASARANVRNPKLAELIRSEQDARKRVTAQSGVLAGVLAMPTDQQDQNEVAALRESIQSLRAAADSLEKEIQRSFPAYAALLNPPAPDIDGLRKALRADEAYISIYLGHDRSYVWAVPKSGQATFATTPLTRDQAEKLVAALRDALNPRAATLGDIPDFDLRLAYRLYQETLEPVAAGWWPAKSLLVSVNGALGGLPLSVLPVKKVRLDDQQGPLFAAYRDVPWLARSHAVTLVPSAAALVTLRSTPEGGTDRKPFIGFGDPYFNAQQVAKAEAAEPKNVEVAQSGETAFRARGLPISLRAAPKVDQVQSPTLSILPRLPDTAQEVRSLAIAMSADPSQSIRVGLEANEKTVKALKLSDYRVVAFATHGLTAGELSGLREPALALSAPDIADADGDGLLTMTEIMGLRLDADWVILSACNTGSGRGAGAEAVSGLGRAFFYAGTRSLLVSSWPVETVSARLLTTDLFRRQQENSDMDRAEALRQAMMALVDRPGMQDEKASEPVFYYAHPIFWAPFVLVGDGGGAKGKS
jgi:CHAT domain-containing protein